uniref:Ig-like domain-containing protein n=1 Tax=Peromyscus maniculatus bairdii TaxID=230844 RepID=A0A8C8UJ49_PERMB
VPWHPKKNCKLLVSSLSTDAQQSKFSIWDYPDYQFFTVTMTALTVRDSGPYFCGVAENRRTIFILRNIYLKVSKDCSLWSLTAPTPPTASWRTTSLNQPSISSLRRVSISSIVVLVVCGLFIKTLVFTVLFTMKPHDSDL